MEEWRDIRGYEGLYQVSNYGRVRSLDRIVKGVRNGKEVAWHRKGEILNQTKNENEYNIVSISKNNNKRVHVLVAEAFIPNPHGYTVVHHKNHNTQDNKVENLVWMSKEEHDALHQRDRAKAAKKTCSKRVDQIDKISGEVLRQWESVKEVKRELGYSNGIISECCNGKRKLANGFVWKYVKR